MFFVLIELCRIEIKEGTHDLRGHRVLIELCRIEIFSSFLLVCPFFVLIELCRIEIGMVDFGMDS